jgi:hypothetical protein
LSTDPLYSPIKALCRRAVLNRVVAVPLVTVMMKMACRPDIMARFAAVRGWLRALGRLATVVMLVILVSMLATLVWHARAAAVFARNHRFTARHRFSRFSLCAALT